MRLELVQSSSTFATRERARQLLAGVTSGDPTVEVSLERVMASPSFLAELLGRLSESFECVTVVDADRFHESMVDRLIGQLRLPNVKVAETAR